VTEPPEPAREPLHQPSTHGRRPDPDRLARPRRPSGSVPRAGIAVLLASLLVVVGIGMRAIVLLGMPDPTSSPSGPSTSPSANPPDPSGDARTGAPPTPGWASAGSLATPRWGAAVATLPGGDVLVAGGTEGSSSRAAVAHVEVYRVATGTWEVVAPMHERRSLAQAVTLGNGLVLVFGGSRDEVPLATAELFDPGTGRWTETAPMTVPRTDFAGVALADGRAMAIGGGTGTGGSSVTRTVEIFDPASGSWSRTGSMDTARAYAEAIVLGEGSVLVAGGRSTYFGSGRTFASAERWAPDTGSWSPAGAMSVPRYHASIALLGGASALVAGGWPDTGSTAALASTEVFDAASGTWETAGDMRVSRAVFAMIALDDGRLLAVAGKTGGLESASTPSAELFDPGTWSWTDAGGLTTAVWYPAVAVLPGNRVLLAGGATDPDGSTSTPDTEVFTPPGP
jgi:hypothetical protein